MIYYRWQKNKGDDNMSDRRAYVKYISSLVMFGTNGIVASYIALSSSEIVVLRTLIGSLFLVVLFMVSKKKISFFNNKKDAFYMLLSGIATGASWLFLYEAYQRIGVGMASLLYYCGPVIVMVLAPIIFNEKLSFEKIMGFTIVLMGVLCINMKAIGQGQFNVGIILGIMSAIMYSAMVIFNKKAESIVGIEKSTWQIVISFLTAFVFVGIKQGFILQIEMGNLLPILILGIFNTGIGCYFYFSSIGKLPVQTVSICGYLEPLAAVVFSILFLGEHMTMLEMAGAVLIIMGAAFGELVHINYQKAVES